MSFCKQCGASLDEDAVFCKKCGSRVEEADKEKIRAKGKSSSRKEAYEGVIRKCPNCGDPIDAFELICDKCGYNFTTDRISTSQERLAAQLEAIERKKGRGWKAKKATCINSFPVSISAEEIVSFMSYACGNIDMDCVSQSLENDKYDKGDHQIAEAWIGKMEQMYHMTKISLSDSPVFSQVEHIYLEKKEEIKKASKKRIWSNPLFWCFFGMAICFVLIPIILGVIEVNTEKHKNQLKEQGMISAGDDRDYWFKNYEYVVATLEGKGFTNIQVIDLDDANVFKKEDDYICGYMDYLFLLF